MLIVKLAQFFALLTLCLVGSLVNLAEALVGLFYNFHPCSFTPHNADRNMQLMDRVAVAEMMELRPDKAIVNLRLYEGTAIHCAEYLCKFYGYHLQLRYKLEGELCIYNIK